MADLVTAAELATHLGIDDPGGGVFDALLDAVEAEFERAVCRSDSPYRAAGSVTEVRDGTGCAELYLRYPINDLTSIKLGADSSDPDETLDVDDLDVVRWASGLRRVVRMDGVFGCKGLPRVVHLAYTCLDDLPEDAARAVMVVAGLRYQRAGLETVTSERLGNWSAEFAQSNSVATGMPFEWTSAVANHMAAVV